MKPGQCSCCGEEESLPVCSTCAHELLETKALRERVAAVEGALRELLSDLTRCHEDGCTAFATNQEQAPYYEPEYCDEHRRSGDDLPWADAARDAQKLLAGGG
jgi:hypothetical protein